MPEPRPTVWTVPASRLFGLASRVYHAAWDRGWLRPERLPGKVISVGNLSAGGSGKTPTVLELARTAREMGLSPAVLTRGYGGNRSGVLLAGNWDSGSRARAEEAGDEPILLSRALPEIPVVVGPRRGRGARELLAAGVPVDLWILDDGFQHRRLARDRDLVLLDANAPLGNGRLLPAGPLREGPFALARAGAVLLTGLPPGEPTAAGTAALLDVHARDIPVRRAWSILEGFTRLREPGPPSPLDPGRPLLAVSGIANPQRFPNLLAAAGYRVQDARVFPDHHRFTSGEIERIEAGARGRGATPVVTAKDAVRLEDLPGELPDWRVAHVRMRTEPDWQDLLLLLLGASGAAGPGLARPTGVR